MAQGSQSLLDRIPDSGGSTALLDRIPGGEEEPAEPDFASAPPGPIYSNKAAEPKYQGGAGTGEALPYSLLESGVRGAEMRTGSAIDWIGSTGQRLLDVAFPGDLTMAERKRRETKAGAVGRELQTYAAKEHPEAQDWIHKVAEGVGGAMPDVGLGVLTGGSSVPFSAVEMGGEHISRAYQDALRASGGDDAAATVAALENIPGAAAMVLPFWSVFGKIAARNPEAGSLIKEALKASISGTAGMGAARVLGEAVSESVDGKDRPILQDALKGAAVDAPVFAFLGGVAGLHGKPGEAPRPEAAKIEGPGEPSPTADVTLGQEPKGPMTVPETPPAPAAHEEIPALPDEARKLVYHGTPHDFEQFDISKIGTGEGAQAFGHGLYFTDKKEIAEHYRNKLTPENTDKIEVDGRSLSLSEAADLAFGPENITPGLRAILADKNDAARGVPGLLEALRAKGHEAKPIYGRVHEVALAPKDDELLDWDKPLSEQSEKVKAALQSAGIETGSMKYPTLKQAEALFRSPRVQSDAASDIGIRESLREGYGYVKAGNEAAFRQWFAEHGKLISPGRHASQLGANTYEKLRVELASPEHFATGPSAASQRLMDLGIRGIRYKANRGRSGESSNYVIFSDKDVEIVKPESAKGAAAETFPLRPANPASGPAEPLSKEAAAPTSEAPGPLPTSTKNAITEQERAMRGEAPLEETARREMPETWRMAEEKMAEDPSLGERVVKGDAIQGLERDVREAVLLREKISAQNDYERVNSALLKAQEAGDAEAIDALTEQERRASDRNQEIDKAALREGVEWGRSGRIRQMLANRDYSLASVETQLRAAKGDRLTPEENARARSLSERLVALEKKVAEMESMDFTKQATKNRTDPTKRQRILSFLDSEAEAARARLKSHRSAAGGGVPIHPTDIVDIAKIAASHIAHGIDAAAQLVSEFGETIKPHLDEIMRKAQQIADEGSLRAARDIGQEKRYKALGAKYAEKAASKDFEPAPKREPVPMSTETLKAKADFEEARREFQKEKAVYRFQNRTVGQKVRDYAREAVNVPKQVMTAYDYSAVLRQGGFLSGAMPIESAKLLPKMAKAGISERDSIETDVALRNRPLAALGEKAGLELTQLDGPLSKHEEHIRSEWANKIPGVKGSNRAFTTFLNMQRATGFDAIVKGWFPDGPTPEQAKDIANFVNIATGRGAVGKGRFAAAVSGLSNVLWSPRLLLSRIQLLTGQPLWKPIARGDVRTTAAIASFYGRSLAALGAVYALAKLAGADVGTDPTSSDFGKIIMGKTHVDPLAGLAQVTVLGSRLALREKTNAKGQTTPLGEPILGNGKGPGYGQSNAFDVLTTFLRTKLSPTIGIPIDVWVGRRVTGERVTPLTAARDMTVPLSFGDILKTMEEQGMERGVALGLLSIFGMGVNTYDKRK